MMDQSLAFLGKIALAAILALAFVAGPGSSAQAQDKYSTGLLALDSAAVCPRNFSMHRDSTLSIICNCGEDAFTGSVWGTDTYTHDSSICNAALHAGAVGPDGGMVLAKGAPGLSSYEGTESNGVRSSNYGSYGWSFVFPVLSKSGFKGADTAEACPNDMTDHRGSSELLTCRCDANAVTGNVWGTDVYTDDSSVCAAALHYGAIGPDGGVVTIFPAPGEDEYFGSSYNGVTSRDYGAWSGSFFFE